MVIPPVLKTGDRKVMWVRVPPLPLVEKETAYINEKELRIKIRSSFGF